MAVEAAVVFSSRALLADAAVLVEELLVASLASAEAPELLAPSKRMLITASFVISSRIAELRG